MSACAAASERRKYDVVNWKEVERHHLFTLRSRCEGVQVIGLPGTQQRNEHPENPPHQIEWCIERQLTNRREYIFSRPTRRQVSTGCSDMVSHTQSQKSVSKESGLQTKDQQWDEQDLCGQKRGESTSHLSCSACHHDQNEQRSEKCTGGQWRA